MTGSRYTNQNSEFLRIDKVKFSVVTSSINIQFNNFFKGLKRLETIANAAINKNLKTIRDTILREVESVLEQKILNSANRILKTAPVKIFFS